MEQHRVVQPRLVSSKRFPAGQVTASATGRFRVRAYAMGPVVRAAGVTLGKVQEEKVAGLTSDSVFRSIDE
jgi:hypothetical protein